MTTSTAFDASALLQQWRAMAQLVPQNLTQPILPGWTFNVNAFNSSAPQTEAEIVQKHSYGRQLGRITEVLEVLVQAHDPARKERRFADFREMVDQIDTIKATGAKARIEQLLKDLDVLKVLDRNAHDALRAELERTLKPRP